MWLAKLEAPNTAPSPRPRITSAIEILMNGLTLLALLAPAAAFQLASPAHFRPRAAIRMQEEEAAPVEEAAAVPESSGPLDRTSPLAGVVGETNLKSFEEKKAEDNAKRLALRERINIGLPAAFFLSLGIASFVGEDKVKAALKGDGSGDPFGNAPGVAEARAKKKEREAKVRCLHDWRCAASFLFISLSIRLTSRVSLSLSRSQAKAEQAEFVEGLRKGIRGEAAVEATKALDD